MNCRKQHRETNTKNGVNVLLNIEFISTNITITKFITVSTEELQQLNISVSEVTQKKE